MSSTTPKKHFDLMIGALLIAGGASGFYFLKSGHFSNVGAYEEEAKRATSFTMFAGSVLKQKGNIRFRFNDSAVWHELDKDSEKVGFGDAVFTAKDGQALLKMKAGQNIEILPNSLVVMNRELKDAGTEVQNDAPIVLKKGHIKITYDTKIAEAKKPIRVEVQGKIYEFKPAAPVDTGAQTEVVTNTIDVVAPAEGSDEAPQITSSAPMEIKSVQAAAIVVPSPSAEEVKPTVEVKPTTEVHQEAKVIPEPQKTQAPDIEIKESVSRSKPKHKVHVNDVAQKPLMVERSPASEAASTSAATPKSVSPPSKDDDLHLSGESFSLTPYFNVTTLNAKDTVNGGTSKLNSSADFGLDAAAFQVWGPSTQTFVHFKIGSISFEPPTSAGKSLNDSSKLMVGFGAGVIEALSSRINVSFTVDDQKALFVRALSTTSVTVDAIMTLGVGGKIDFDLIKVFPFTLGLSGLGHALFPSSTDAYSTKLGSDYGGVFYVKRDLHQGTKLNYQFELGFTRNSQNSALTDQTENITSLRVRFFFPASSFSEAESAK